MDGIDHRSEHMRLDKPRLSNALSLAPCCYHYKDTLAFDQARGPTHPWLGQMACPKFWASYSP